jgi:hypothetical protein
MAFLSDIRQRTETTIYARIAIGSAASSARGYGSRGGHKPRFTGISICPGHYWRRSKARNLIGARVHVW